MMNFSQLPAKTMNFGGVEIGATPSVLGQSGSVFDFVDLTEVLSFVVLGSMKHL